MQKKNVVFITLLFSLNSCLDWGRKPVENKDSDLETQDIQEENSDTEALCNSPLVECSGYCVDTTKDHENCGGCGIRCDLFEICVNSVCRLDCGDRKIECDGECVDVSSDVENCGDCGIVCTAGEHATVSCENGECKVTCIPGWLDNDGDGNCETCTPYGSESCDGIDNNCDGKCDEGFECCAGRDVESRGCGNCGSQIRRCTSSCTWGVWEECTG